MFTARRRWVVLGVWLVVLLLVGGLVRSLGAETSNNLELPGTDSLRASNLLAERFPPQQNGKNPIVFEVSSGKVSDAGPRRAIAESNAAMRELPQVVSAPSPFSQAGAAQVSEDERTAFIPVLLDIPNADLTEEFAQRLLDAAEPARQAGMEVAAGGQVGAKLSEPETESSEVVGLATAMLILALTFGTMVAMGLPIVTALFGLLIGLSLIGLLGHLASVPAIGPTLATMIGLGVGIDYALFLFTRYRTFRAEGRPTEDAIAMAVATSGSAIVFAGSTVVAALLILIVAGIPLVTSLGYAAAVAVVTAVLASITLLPAILAVLGHRVDSLRLPVIGRKRAAGEAGGGIWIAWGRFVVRRPWHCAAAAIVLLALLAIPFGSLELGQEDVGSAPKSTTERQAYDMVAAGFGVGYNGPLLVAVELGSPARPGKQFESEMREAKALQAELEGEQASGQAEATRLQGEADALTAKQGDLEGEGAALEGQAAALDAERTQIEAERARLESQRTLSVQLRQLTGEARSLASRKARLAGQTAAISRQLEATRAEQARVEAELAEGPGPGRTRRLERRLAQLGNREAGLISQLEATSARQSALQREVDAVASQAARLRAEAAQLGGEARALAGEAGEAVREAAAVASERSALEGEVAAAKVQAATLQGEKAQLEALQEVAQLQQQQAETLKTALTADLTKAGGDERGTDPRLVRLQNGLERALGVDVVSPPQINEKGDAAIFNVVATTAPADPRTADLVRTLRDFTIPQQTAGSDVRAFVGGQTASYVDLAAAISSRLGLVILAVVALGFLVLMVAFRSLLVPAQAALANVLAAAAAFGVLTACFQWGWGLPLVGLDTASGTDPIASFVPLIMFAVLFGLSMDYQVFLISQIEQHRGAGVDEREAIAAGVASGARVIGAAAAIMIAVFASFILNGDPTVKQFGVGLSVGVGLAAMSVLVLAPAVLAIAGRWSWWVPPWADRVLPRVDLE